MSGQHNEQELARSLQRQTSRQRKPIEQWLRHKPAVRVGPDVILDYLRSGQLPTITDESGWVSDYRFHPEAARKFALLWAECWLGNHPEAQINSEVEWARCVAGGAKHMEEYRKAKSQH